MTIDVIGIGAAPGDNTGDGLRTAMAKVNNNFGSSANAASKLVGTATGEVPTADDLFVVGETNWSTANYQPETNLNGLGVVRLMKNLSGGIITSGATIAGSMLSGTYLDASGAGQGGIASTGTWINVSGLNLSANLHGSFVRIV